MNGTRFTLLVCQDERKPEENTPLINGIDKFIFGLNRFFRISKIDSF